MEPPTEIFKEGMHCWKNAWWLNSLGVYRTLACFIRLVNVLWGANGEVEIRPVGANLFIIQLHNSSTRD